MCLGITLSFIVLDLITGIIKGFSKGNFSSRKLRKGLYHKLGSILSITLGYMIEYSSQWLNITNIPIKTPICLYIVVMEISSIIENIAIINPDIFPNDLYKIFNINRGDKNE